MFTKLKNKNYRQWQFALAALLCSTLTTPLHAAERVGDFSLLDQNGKFHHIAWYDDHKAIAFLVQVNGSEATRAAVAEYERLQAQFDTQGIE